VKHQKGGRGRIGGMGKIGRIGRTGRRGCKELLVQLADSRAVTLRIGATPSGPKITRPAVISPRNSI
jgi:hypothetical protein